MDFAVQHRRGRAGAEPEAVDGLERDPPVGRRLAEADSEARPRMVFDHAAAGSLAGFRAADLQHVLAVARDVAKAMIQVPAQAIYDLLKPAIEAISPWFDAAWDAVIAGVKFATNAFIKGWLIQIEALKMANWVQKDAAELLSISPRVMNYKIKTLGIDFPRSRRMPMGTAMVM